MAIDSTSDRVWMVSFEISEDGKLQNYHVEEKDLADYRQDVAASLREMFGKGLFNNKEEAVAWADNQLAEVNKSCCGKTGGCCRNRE